MEVVHVLALHGFLGQAQDWQLVQKTTQEQLQKLPQHDGLQLNWWTPNFFSNAENEWDLSSLDNLSEQLLQATKKIPGRKIFAGYSLGGRMGLHLMEKASEEFEHFLFLSTHPGLQSEAEKKVRLQQDESWAQSIQKDSWYNFIQKWNQQSVFENKESDPRKESDFSKIALAAGMRNLSLAKQKNFNEEIKRFKHKITWAVGQRDTKFLNLANELVADKILDEKKELDAGHRVLLDSPSQVGDLILKVI